jgi:hypothetical protein
MKLTETDRRHTGSLEWKYFVSMPYNMGKTSAESKTLFLEWRVWCWNTWGPSKELNAYGHNDLYDDICCSNSHWCWLSDDNGRRRIYLRSDHDAELFSLRWS